MKFKRISFKNTEGADLSARIDFPLDGIPRAFAVFAHCFTCTKNSKAIATITSALTQKGLAVLRFDFTGLGESQGDFADTNFSSNVSDLIAAAEFLSSFYEAPQLLIGHSFGGTACLQAARDLPQVKAVATIGSPAHPRHVVHLLAHARKDIEQTGAAKVLLAGRPFQIKKQFLDDLENARVDQVLPELKCALLVLHSPRDEVVGIENAAQIYQAARHPKSFISLDNADHMMSDSRDSDYVGAVIAQWAARYIRPSERKDSKPPSNEHAVVASIGGSRFRTAMVARGHGIIADEPVHLGGTDAGPTPYELVGAGLAACMAITVRMYADGKAWPLEGVTIRCAHSKIDARSIPDKGSRRGKIDRFSAKIALDGSLTEDQRKRLMMVAERCPVHQTLLSEAIVETEEERELT
jgi:uncharacterized OsmC-like protein/alpha/beta superfamily hydrolase